jgi:hypothetical protein
LAQLFVIVLARTGAGRRYRHAIAGLIQSRSALPAAIPDLSLWIFSIAR